MASRTFLSDDGTNSRWRLVDDDGRLLGEEVTPSTPAAAANAAALKDRADQAIAALQVHIDRGTFNATQRDAALLLSLRVVVALSRLTLGRLESSA